MTNDELKNLLEWVENKGEFIWEDLQNYFGYDDKKMTLVQNVLRSNMLAQNNLVDHSYVSGGNPKTFILTSNGRTMLTNLKNQLSKNPWYQKPIGTVILAVIPGLIIAVVIYFLGWN